MEFTATVVGSFPRTRELIEATKKHTAGELTKEELDSVVEKAIEDTIRGEETAGLDVITDGEQRRSSFVSFVGDKIPGFKVMHITKLNPAAMEILKRNKVELTYTRPLVSEPLKDAFPSLGKLLHPLLTLSPRFSARTPFPRVANAYRSDMSYA